MSVYEGADEAPQKRMMGHPTGFRRLTPGLLKVDRTAENFAGLPADVEVHGRLLAAFKEAAPRLGYSSRLVHAIDWLFRFTQPQDWRPTSRPIVWPSAAMQQDALSLSPTQVKAINRQLIEAGLVTMHDSPNGKRWGKRDPKGRIVEAYGFDLAPIAARYAEFVRVADEGRAEREALRRLRRRATIARNGIYQILDTVEEYGFESEEWATVARDTKAIAKALRSVTRPDEMKVGVESLERRQRARKQRLEALLGTVDSVPMEPENRPHYTTTNLPENPIEDTVLAQRACSSPVEPSVSNSPKMEQQEVSEKGRVLRLKPDELVRLAPRLKPYLRRPDPTWPDLIDAAEWLRHDLDVSKPLWGEACVSMGREMAAIALAIVSTKDPEHFRTTPGGYFRGMVVKAKVGELNLDRTLWAMRRAKTADSQPEAGRGGRWRRGEDRVS